ncbi:MAG: hypothetical protein R2828_11365 [Saprospiraceae bacterium]
MLLPSAFTQQRFNAGVVLGANFAQIDGDYQFGFHKKGIMTGARAIAYLNPWLEMNIDLLYSQRGAKQSYRKNPIVAIDLNYVESVFLLNFKIPAKGDLEKDPKGRKKKQLNEFRPFHLQLGVSYGRLVNSTVSTGNAPRSPFLPQLEVSFQEMREHFNRNDLSVVPGVSYFFSRNIGVTFHAYFPTRSLYDKEQFPDRISRSMRSFFYSLQLAYLL